MAKSHSKVAKEIKKKTIVGIPNSVMKNSKKEHNIFKAFLFDYPCGGNIYDASFCQWTVYKENGNLVWKPKDPLSLRVIIPSVFSDVGDIPRALIRLAVCQGFAFRVSSESLKISNSRYGLVFIPKGDRRAAHLAHKPEKVYELDELSSGTALLFEGEFPEDIGHITADGQIDKKNTMYGLSVWGRFCAIEVVNPFTEPAFII